MMIGGSSITSDNFGGLRVDGGTTCKIFRSGQSCEILCDTDMTKCGRYACVLCLLLAAKRV